MMRKSVPIAGTKGLYILCASAPHRIRESERGGMGWDGMRGYPRCARKLAHTRWWTTDQFDSNKWFHACRWCPISESSLFRCVPGHRSIDEDLLWAYVVLLVFINVASGGARSLRSSSSTSHVFEPFTFGRALASMTAQLIDHTDACTYMYTYVLLYSWHMCDVVRLRRESFWGYRRFARCDMPAGDCGCDSRTNHIAQEEKSICHNLFANR